MRSFLFVLLAFCLIGFSFAEDSASEDATHATDVEQPEKSDEAAAEATEEKTEASVEEEEEDDGDLPDTINIVSEQILPYSPAYNHVRF